MQPNVLPFRVDRFAYRADGDFWVRTVCRICDKKFEVYAAGPIPSDDLCGECQQIQMNMNVIYGNPDLPRVPFNWGPIIGGTMIIAALTGVWFLVIYCGVEGYKHVNGVTNAIVEALR